MVLDWGARRVQQTHRHLVQCKIPLYSYNVEDFELDLKNLWELVANLAAIQHLQLLHVYCGD